MAEDQYGVLKQWAVIYGYFKYPISVQYANFLKIHFKLYIIISEGKAALTIQLFPSQR
jgi:hypothetical protein